LVFFLLLFPRDYRIRLDSRALGLFLFSPGIGPRRGARLLTPVILEEALAATDAFRRIRRERPAQARNTRMLVDGTAPLPVTAPSSDYALLPEGRSLDSLPARSSL